MSDAMHGEDERPEGAGDEAGTPSTGSTAPATREAGREGEGGEGAGLLRTVLRGLVALAILAGGTFAAFWFNWTEGEAQSGEGAPESARLVEVVKVERGPTRVTVRAMGTVEPAREVVIRPRVGGEIVRQNEAFVPGGHFEEGEFLVQIDRADYQHALRQRQSELTQAEATLKIERGDQAVAQEELQLFEGDIPEANRALILRKPQVNQAKAAVESARAAVDDAELDLERTRLAAPFDGQLVSRSASAGDNVSQGDQLATYVGSDRYWVRLAVPVRHLRWIDVPAGPSSEQGSRVRLTNESAWGPSGQRVGRVTQLIGRLTEASRTAEVMVSVRDPLALEEGHGEKPRLLLGSFVDARLEGRRIEDVAVIDRSYLRTGGVVWVMNGEDQLDVRDVSVLFQGRRKAYVGEGLKDGDQVVKTNLSAPVDGMLLRTTESGGGDAASDGEGTDDE